MAAEFTELKVLKYRQHLSVFPKMYETNAVLPGSVSPFLFRPHRKGALLVSDKCKGSMTKLRFEIQKDGQTFWIGAAVPAGTTDFSRCYIYFYPDTLRSDSGYKTFKGWESLESHYVDGIGAQMAAAKPMTLIVPFTTLASRTNDAQHNMFASQGIETLNDLMTAIQMEVSNDPIAKAVGEDVKPRPGELKAIGLASFSSGVNHLNSFVDKVKGSGLIREIIDFDGQHILLGARRNHRTIPVLNTAVNWYVTQNEHPLAAIKDGSSGQKRNPLTPPKGWLYLPAEVFRNVTADDFVGKDVHDVLGHTMFWTMMTLSTLS